jgi:serine/threonine protein kinase
MAVDTPYKEEEVIDSFMEQLLGGGNGLVLNDYCLKYPALRNVFEQKYNIVRALDEAFTDESLGGTEIGDYLIIREIGRGGMGVVYMALQQSLHRYVALKVLPFGFTSDGGAIKRFRREGQTIAKFNHPNIVPVYSMGEEKGNCYIAMALIQGLSLNKILLRLRQVPVNEWSAGLVRDIIYTHPDFTRLNVGADRTGKIEPIIFARDPSFWSQSYTTFALTLCAEIADALSYAHANGICHGDLKPSNIMLTHGGVPMIVDFGLAKDMRSLKDSQSLEFLGTIAYASPEQIEKNIVSPASEIWSLGVTMYEMLSLEQPFHSDNVAGTVEKILNREPPLLRVGMKGFPKDTQAIVFKCLEKAPQNRYAGAEMLEEDINNFLLSKPVIARPVGKLGRSMKRVKRNKVVSILICALVVLLMAGSFLAPNYLVKGYMDQGARYRDEGKFQESVDAYGRALKLLKVPLFSKNTEASALSGMGDTLEVKGDFQGAMSFYKRALQINPNYSPALAGIGDVYYEEGQYAEAVTWYSRAISLSPEDRDNYYERGQAYEKQGLYREALRDFRKAIQLAPNDRDTIREISGSLSKMGLSENDRDALLREEGFNETEAKSVLELIER